GCAARVSKPRSEVCQWLVQHDHVRSFRLNTITALARHSRIARSCYFAFLRKRESELKRNTTCSWSATAVGAVAIVAKVAGGISWARADDALRSYTVIGDAIPASLTGAPGD